MAAADQQAERGPVQDVLRYWLGSLRLDEALSARPLARKTRKTRGPGGAALALAAVPNTGAPTPGQDYFKLRLIEKTAGPRQNEDPTPSAAELVCRGRVLTRQLDPELAAFFEDYLYRAMRSGSDEEDAGHLLCFPVVHLPRGELAGLLRMRTALTFHLADGAAFRVRKGGAWRRKGGNPQPPPPVEVRVGPKRREPADWPFFIDTRVLHRQLGFDGDAIDQLFESLRGCDTMTERRMLSLVLRALERQQQALPVAASTADPGDTPGDDSKDDQAGDDDDTMLLSRLSQAVEALAQHHAPRVRVFPYGIVMDGTQAKTTWHLQRELQGLLRSGETLEQARNPLTSYVTGVPLPMARDWQRALCDGPALTDRQRGTAEHVWGSAFCAVQGPPGTGKTTLIQHLFAEFLVRKLEPLLVGDDMAPDIMVVASSNNRAVDNALEGFAAPHKSPHSLNDTGGPGALPACLRAGSRRVCEGPLLAQLMEARHFLDSAIAARERPDGLEFDFQGALDAFREARDRCNQVLATDKHRFDSERRQAQITLALAELGPAPPHNDADPLATASVNRDAVGQLAALEGRLMELSDLCDQPPGLGALQTVDRHLRRTQAKQLGGCEALLSALDITLPLPPDLPASTDPKTLLGVWQEAAEEALEALEHASRRAQDWVRELEQHARRTALEAELATLERSLSESASSPKGPHGEQPLEDRPLDGRPLESRPLDGRLAPSESKALFAAAVQLRKAWAAKHAERLLPAVDAALHQCQETRSLKPMARDDPEGFRLLHQLFGLWGCTLLSLGNCFPPTAASIRQLVIDEAGQCHPAHAISGLLRCESALLIGDVHQLTPVVQLSQDDDARLLRQLKLATAADDLTPFRVHAESHASAQSLADRAAATPLRLVDHFRCQPEIIAISDRLCGYDLVVHTGRHVRLEAPRLLRAPVAWLETAGEQERLGGSWFNPAELERVFDCVDLLLDSGVAPSDLAVITPYRGQLERLRRGFARRRIPLEASPEVLDADADSGAPTPSAHTGIAVGTVHRFQGGERSIVMFSSVVSSRRRLPFLNQRPNLVNVAVSRARHHFIGIGQRHILAQGSITGVLARAAAPLDIHLAEHLTKPRQLEG